MKRPRITVRRLMIAVGILALALASGIVARDRWPTPSTVVRTRPLDDPKEVGGSLEWTIEVSTEQSAWPSVMAMATTATTLMLLWLALAKVRRAARALRKAG